MSKVADFSNALPIFAFQHYHFQNNFQNEQKSETGRIGQLLASGILLISKMMIFNFSLKLHFGLDYVQEPNSLIW